MMEPWETCLSNFAAPWGFSAHTGQELRSLILTMAALIKGVRAFAMMYPILGASAIAGSIADIEHVILFMQGWYPPIPSTLQSD
jgi:hypothetical protein